MLCDNVYVYVSSIPTTGFGLYANKKFVAGEPIVKFTGTLVDNESAVNNIISSIQFPDGKYLDCYVDDVASKCNDVVNITRNARNISDIINSSDPIYKMHPYAKLNAIIKMHTENHTAWIEARTDIEPNEEIFVHYGLKYWMSHDLYYSKIIIDKLTYLDKPIYHYDCFVNYVKLFYPEHVAISIDPAESNVVYLNDISDSVTPIYLVDELVYVDFDISEEDDSF